MLRLFTIYNNMQGSQTEVKLKIIALQMSVVIPHRKGKLRVLPTSASGTVTPGRKPVCKLDVSADRK